MHVRVCVCARARLCVHVYVYATVSVCMCVCVYVCVRAHTCKMMEVLVAVCMITEKRRTGSAVWRKPGNTWVWLQPDLAKCDWVWLQPDCASYDCFITGLLLPGLVYLIHWHTDTHGRARTPTYINETHIWIFRHRLKEARIATFPSCMHSCRETLMIHGVDAPTLWENAGICLW